MNRRLFLALATSITLAAAAPAFAQTSTWTMDKSHTQANFQIRHLGLSNVRGSISGVVGKFVWDEKDPAKCSVTATLDANTVSTNNEGRDKHLKTPDFFNVEKFPTMTFKSTSITRVNGKLKVTGDFTMVGVTKSITLDVDGPSAPQPGRGGKLNTGFSATGLIKRSDFNFGTKYPAAVLGDDVNFTLDVEASKD